MIEYRAILMKDRKFEGGFKLKKGTVIYAWETPSGWIGTYYEDTGSAHSFALEDGDFSIWQSGDVQAQYLVVMPDPPEPPEDIAAHRELERRRITRRIERHREEADQLESLLASQEKK